MCDTTISMKKFQKGFTLLEILIVVAIIVLLSMVVLMSLRGQTARANDTKRKMDLYTLSKSFEDYYNDNGAFPVQSVVDNCGGTMESYITRIPCDPVSRTHYGYFPSVSGGYRICAKLSDMTDPAIAAMNCTGANGCGVGCGYNYCLASGVTASAVGTEDEIPCVEITPTPTPTPGGGTPTPTPTPYAGYHWACASTGHCNYFNNPYSEQHKCGNAWLAECPGYVEGVPFSGACADLANLCAD